MKSLLLAVTMLCMAAPAPAQTPAPFMPFQYDAKTGKLTLEVTRLDHDFLYLTSLATGLGSNDLGLDRGTIGSEAVVRFERHGPRLFLVQRNLNFRATSPDTAAARAVEESFASSVLAAFTIQSEERGKYIVDATDFLLQDVFDVRGALQAFNARNASAPSASEVISTMIESVYTRSVAATPYEAALRRVSRRAVADALLNLAASQNATPEVRAVAEYHLDRLGTRLAALTPSDTGDRALNASVVRDARNWLDKRIAPPKMSAPIQLPPGTPIGN